MGVDFFNCDICGGIFADCGPCKMCENCSSYLCGECGDREAKKYGLDENGHLQKCAVCMREVVSDGEILNFLLRKHCLTKEEVMDTIRKSERTMDGGDENSCIQ